MKVTVNPDRCVGHGICESLAPDVFAVGDDGLAHAAEPIPPSRHGVVAEAVAACPSQALNISE